MRIPDERERVNEQWPPFVDAFREIYRFILKAMDGNADAANAAFRKYLNGELPDELLRISQSWGQEEQGTPEGDRVGAADFQTSECLTPVGPVEGRRLRRARNRRRRGSHLLSRRGRTSGPSLDVGERA